MAYRCSPYYAAPRIPLGQNSSNEASRVYGSNERLIWVESVQNTSIIERQVVIRVELRRTYPIEIVRSTLIVGAIMV